MLEAHYATADDIDTAMKYGCALPMGPFELLDVVGNDVSLAIQRELYLEFREPGFAPAPLLEHLVTAGYLGRKTKRGFRDYTVPDRRSDGPGCRGPAGSRRSATACSPSSSRSWCSSCTSRGADPARPRGSATGFLTYLLSFVYIGIYWNNHPPHVPRRSSR